MLNDLGESHLFNFHLVICLLKRGKPRVSDKSLFPWGGQFDERQGTYSGEAASLKSEIAKLELVLKPTSVGRDILKRSPHTLPRCPDGIRIHKKAPRAVLLPKHVQGAASAAQL